MLQSRSFEITAMQEAMRNAKYVDILLGHAIFDSLNRAGSTHRAWQELPRHLRRRAASHNVQRVPLRLRNRSRAEVRSGSLYPCMVL
jgi:ribonuclease P/MRP protein subunit POP1